MCARFVLKKAKQDLESFFDLKLSLDLPPRYNIAPTQPVLAIREEAAGRKGAMLTWGLVPHWAKDPSIGTKMINARSEGIAAKPAYRDAYRYRRCLIPADGFYEWETIGKIKQPFFIHRVDAQTIAFAGLWEHWQDPHGSEIESCTIITTASNEDLAKLHDRMPVILERGIWGKWLAPLTPMEEVGGMLAPAPAGTLQAYAVNRRVSNPRHDDAGMIERVEVRRDVQQDLFGR